MQRQKTTESLKLSYLQHSADVLESSTKTGAWARERSFVLYRNQMLKLLAYPKPVFDQLVIELPCLMGFRAKEVTTWRAEYLNFQDSDAFVFDAKKHRLFTVPLNLNVARLTEQVLNGRHEGYILQTRSNAWKEKCKDKPLSPISIWYIWNKWTRKACLHASEISPITGRRFFALEYARVQENMAMAVVELQHILRHDEPETTWRYISKLIYYEDIKQGYNKFEENMREALAQLPVQAPC